VLSVPKKPENKPVIKTPTEHYRAEKDKRATKDAPDDELMAAARREYQAMLAAQAAKGKGGRPKKNAAAKPDPAEDAEDLPGNE
jgi:hypothetical protein